MTYDFNFTPCPTPSRLHVAQLRNSAQRLLSALTHTEFSGRLRGNYFAKPSLSKQTNDLVFSKGHGKAVQLERWTTFERWTIFEEGVQLNHHHPLDRPHLEMTFHAGNTNEQSTVGVLNPAVRMVWAVGERRAPGMARHHFVGGPGVGQVCNKWCWSAR